MIKEILKKFLVFTLVVLWIFSGWPQVWQNPSFPPKIQKTYATNYLSNPSFTSGTTNWTLSTMTYNSSYYQDSAGSVELQTAAGRNNTATGYARQTISTNIEAGSTVNLSLYWSKQCVAVNCTTNTVQVDIIKPSSSQVTIWSDATIPSYGSPTSWTGPSNLNVSSYFDETGQYQIQVYASLRNGNNKSAQSLAWFDNLNLDVTPLNITTSTTGTQTSTTGSPITNFYVGGAFTFVRSAESANITQIIINEEGTINANSNLSNLDLYYETAGTCTYDGNETLFGTASSFNSSDQATITGTMAVGTSQVCVYAVLDVGYGASPTETIELEISNPSADITVSSGTVGGSSPVQISGNSTIVKLISVSIDDGSIEYGVLDSNATADTVSSQTQTVTNNGNVTEDFEIKGYNATGGGCTWTLVSGTPSTDQYKHEFSINSGTNWYYLGTSYQSLISSKEKGSNFDLDLKITMPTTSDCLDAQDVDVTVLASAH
ncbi:MAG: hypothetical protein MCSN_0790 [Candidatus Microsyncoccus archaeolyticus]|nr:MAG: hypothetical protein MCSN_0790 [Candidatus Parcubacteria bacterium]